MKKAQNKRLVCYSAVWCGPCKMFKPILRELTNEGYDVQVVDIDQNPHIAQANKIFGVPTSVVYDKENREIERLQGVRTKEDLVRILSA
tara:strand:- start:407 stop:673 length:267 start_codon:yes stop_codon:yes gene_type:complete